MPKIICFFGYIHSGKSSAAQAVEALGAKRLPFAKPLKDMLFALGLTHDHINGTRKELPCDLLCGRTPRYAMQTLGTEWRDMIGQDLWTNIWEHQVRRFDRVVVDDMRFPHEYVRIKHHNSLFVKIVREGYGPRSHASESHIEDFPPDAVLVNNGTEMDFRNRVSALAQEFFARK